MLVMDELMLSGYRGVSNNSSSFDRGAWRRRRRQEQKGVSLPIFKFLLRYFTPERGVRGRRASSGSGL